MTQYEDVAPGLARNRALILKILRWYPEGLTTQQIIEQEIACYGYSFLTDNRLRELRHLGLVESINEFGKPLRWKTKNV